MRYKTVAGLMLLLVAVGCSQKLNSDQKALVAGAALYANERAASWILNAQDVVAKEDKWSADVELFKKKHGENLAAQAVAFSKAIGDIVDGKLGKVSRAHLIESASTAKAQHENFHLMRPHLKASTPEKEVALQAYFDAHEAGLKDLSDRLGLLAEQLKGSK